MTEEKCLLNFFVFETNLVQCTWQQHTMAGPRGVHRDACARKRSLAVVGMLFPVFVHSSSFAQHRVRPATRSVSYQTCTIPSALGEHIGRTESKNKKNSLGDLWHIHADAVKEPPDRMFEEIRRGVGATIRQDDEKEEVSDHSERNIATSFLRGLGLQLSATKLLFENVVADQSNKTDDKVPTIYEGEANATNAASSGFNVSVGTKYDVDFVGNDTSTANDSSTVVFTTSEKNIVNSSSNFTDEESALRNATDISDNNGTSRAAHFRPLRMRAFLSELAGGGQHLTRFERSSLLQSIIKPALLSWSAALRLSQ